MNDIDFGDYVRHINYNPKNFGGEMHVNGINELTKIADVSYYSNGAYVEDCAPLNELQLLRKAKTGPFLDLRAN